MSNDIELTPMMKQFLDLKAKHPDAVMLFRCGDFYETYSTDAIIAAEILGITLTKRANGKGKTVEMAGFPHHALDTYLPKLIRAGKRVAICDQLEDPKTTKKLVKRGITELVTPGVSINDNVLNYKENNFLAAVHFGKSACFFVLSLFVCSMFTSCNKESTTECQTIDFSTLFDGQPEKIPLKEWAKSIHFVQLETNDSILIGNIRATILHKDKILVHHNNLSLFDLSGKFICNIGSKGGGPT